ncbi:MAG: hypothetical protein AAF945_18840, partial [Actinomycetota bacterium]
MRRRVAAAAWTGALALVACASPAVTTESADVAGPGSVPRPTEVAVPDSTTGAPDATGDDPSATSVDDDVDVPVETDDVATTTSGEPRDPDTAVGDTLFETLGSYVNRTSYDTTSTSTDPR